MRRRARSIRRTVAALAVSLFLLAFLVIYVPAATQGASSSAVAATGSSTSGQSTAAGESTGTGESSASSTETGSGESAGGSSPVTTSQS
jgi:hypothetical protein